VAAGLLTVGALAPSASAASSGWEAILGGHMTSGLDAQRVVDQATAAHFKAHVQQISPTNWEAEIFNGGRTRSEAKAMCAQARQAGLPRCSVEQEFHGNGWSSQP
jgi:hypothetical protein